MIKVYLVRHGHTDTMGTFDSRSNIPLNSKGRAVSIRLGQWLKKFKIGKIYSSPTRRAIETADILHVCLNVPYETEKDLQEINFGEWQGKTYQEICEQYPDYQKEIIAKQELFTYQNGESIKQFNQRVWKILRKLSSSTNQDIVLITHKGVIESIISKILSISSIFPPLIINPACCSILFLSNNEWSIRSFNTQFDYEDTQSFS